MPRQKSSDTVSTDLESQASGVHSLSDGCSNITSSPGSSISSLPQVLSVKTSSSPSLGAELLDSVGDVDHSVPTILPHQDRVAAANSTLKMNGVWWKVAKSTTQFPYNWVYFLIATAASLGVGASLFVGD